MTATLPAAAAARTHIARSEAAERRRGIAAATFAIALHLLLAVAAYRAARPHPPGSAAPPIATNTIMHLRLIDAADTLALPAPNLPPLAPGRIAPAPSAAPPLMPAVASSPSSMAPAAAAGGSEPVPSWIDRDGSVRLPAATAAPRTFSNRPLREAGAPDPLAHRDVLPYVPTRFEKHWVPRDETLGGELLRNATAERTVDLPQGYQLRCVWMLVLGGCGWGKAPQATIEELKAMRADPPMPRALAAGAQTAPPAVTATPDAAAVPPQLPLDLSLPPPLVMPVPPPGRR